MKKSLIILAALCLVATAAAAGFVNWSHGRLAAKTVVFSANGVNCTDGAVTLNNIFRVRLDLDSENGLICTWQTRCDCAFLVIGNGYFVAWEEVAGAKIVQAVKPHPQLPQ